MPAIPRSLEDLSLELLVKNVQAYAEEKETGGLETSGHRHPFFHPPPYTSPHNPMDLSDDGMGLSLGGGEASEPCSLPLQPLQPLPSSIGNKLLAGVRSQGLLNSHTAQLFRRSAAHLSHANLSDASLRDEDLGFLGEHRLLSLQLRDLPGINLPRLLTETLSAESRQELRLLDISYSFPKGSSLLPLASKPKKTSSIFTRGLAKRAGGGAADGGGGGGGGGADGEAEDIDSALPFSLRSAILALESLQSLKLAGTAVDNAALKILALGLPGLSSLDISVTEVSDLSPLIRIKGQLRNLILFNTPVTSAAELCDLEALEVLDISDASSMGSANQGGQNSSPQARLTLAKDLLLEAESRFLNTAAVALPRLRVLDVSGLQGDLNGAVLSHFIHLHPALCFLGLIKNSFRALSDEWGKWDRLEVAGDGNLKQILAGLRLVSGGGLEEEDFGWGGVGGGCRWRERESFLSAQLHAAFSELHSNFEGMVGGEGAEVLRLVLAAMGGLRKSVGIQMAGTACLYNLCRSQRAGSYPAQILGRVVTRCLDALEGHPAVSQLAKNVWLTLCNDLILQAGCFDLYRCCELALESMTLHPEEAAITRMTVAIVSILAAKIPIQRTTTLGANARYMDFMLGIVGSKLEDHYAAIQHQPNGAEPPAPDVTLKFTLSALWNLTDESPTTSEQFLANKGLDVVLRVLETYKDEASIQTKILGLLNNVAEVGVLKERLASHPVLKEILRLLWSNKIEVSYFAAGILAHLCVGKPWDTKPTWTEALEALEQRIAEWGRPDNEMVAYRSFRPFFPLLEREDLPGVQLWAVWAVRHVCAKSRNRYLPLFLQEDGDASIRNILQSSNNSHIRSLCQEIMEQIHNHRSHQSHPPSLVLA